MLKGIFTALVIIILGGTLSIYIKMPPSSALVFISTSVINNITTNSNSVIEEEKNATDELEKFIEEEEVAVLTEVEKEVEVVEEKKETEVIVEEKKEEPKVEVVAPVTPNGSYAPNLAVANTYTAINTYYGSITAYGPDCYGCSGFTASGKDVRNGNIYYNDATFGNIRIVAGDRSLRFGTIIKITGLNITSDPLLAIVLDTGGAIGFNRNHYFDLLYISNAEAMSFGVQKATFEVLRNGY